MLEHRIKYTRRTLEHIHRVHFNMLCLIKNLPVNFFNELRLDERELMYQVMHHDISKFNDVQFYAYADYFNGDRDKYAEAAFKFAIENHYHNENHHHQGQFYMNPNQVIEMVCDWQAMAQEFNEGSCRKYYEEKWRKEYLEYYRNSEFALGYNGNTDDYEFFKMEGIIEACISCFEKACTTDAEYKEVATSTDNRDVDK